MDNNIVKEGTAKPPSTRRKLLQGIGIFSMFAAFASIKLLPLMRKKDVIDCGPENSNKTVRMLTQDGRLVEIDASLMKAAGKKITDAELQHWVNK